MGLTSMLCQSDCPTLIVAMAVATVKATCNTKPAPCSVSRLQVTCIIQQTL